jgi:hypothetical protein
MCVASSIDDSGFVVRYLFQLSIQTASTSTLQSLSQTVPSSLFSVKPRLFLLKLFRGTTFRPPGHTQASPGHFFLVRQLH